MSVRSIRVAAGPLDAVVRAAPSKSVTHRALVAAALARGRSELIDPLDADDTRITRDGLAGLGIGVHAEPGRWSVEGADAYVPGGAELFLGESGTSMRFLLAVAALGERPSVLDGAPRLRERPIRELARAIEVLGGHARCGDTPGGLPVETGGAALHGGTIRLPGSPSSQFASALMLVGSQLPGGLELELEAPVVSLPYVEVTEAVLADFGARVVRRGELAWHLPPGRLRARRYRIEGDHSSASYFLAAAAVVGGRVRVDNLSPTSAQADARLRRILDGLGCEVRCGEDWIEVRGAPSIPAFDLDMGDCPDLVPTVAVVALFAEGPCRIRGVAHLRHKESDRLEVLAQNLRLLGRPAATGADRLEVGPPAGPLHGAVVATASDHRMAMAFAVAGLRIEGLTVDDADCVGKSNPGFWKQLERLEGSGSRD